MFLSLFALLVCPAFVICDLTVVNYLRGVVLVCNNNYDRNSGAVFLTGGVVSIRLISSRS